MANNNQSFALRAAIAVAVVGATAWVLITPPAEAPAANAPAAANVAAASAAAAPAAFDHGAVGQVPPGSDVLQLNQRTFDALATGDLAAAHQLNQTALAAEPKNLDARANKAFITALVGMADRANTYLDEVLSEDPKHARALAYRGVVALRQGRRQAAVSSLQAAVDEGLQDPWVTEALAVALTEEPAAAPGHASVPGHPPMPGHPAN